MKYKDLIHFEPITSVIQLVNAADLAVAKNLVKTFVFSKTIKDLVKEVVIKNLNPNPSTETKGIQIVGSYGTGKSHLMAVVTAIAENAELLSHLESDDVKDLLKIIAGKYKVLRFEMGTDKPLKDVVFAQIERFLEKEKVKFAFDENSTDSWKVEISKMMAAVEEKFPNYHFLMVIDEMLQYLKGRNPTQLNNDLMLLQQLGEAVTIPDLNSCLVCKSLFTEHPNFNFRQRCSIRLVRITNV